MSILLIMVSFVLFLLKATGMIDISWMIVFAPAIIAGVWFIIKLIIVFASTEITVKKFEKHIKKILDESEDEKEWF